MAFLQHNHLRTPSEEVVLSAVLEWCRKRERLDKFPELSAHIRFELISVKFVLRFVRDDAGVRANAAVTNSLLDKIQALPVPLPALSRPRFSTQVLVAMPYRSKTFYLITFFGDHIEFVVKQFPEMIHEHIDALINYSVCKVGENLLYMAGGTGYNVNNEPFHSDKGFVYDLVEDAWTPSANLQGDSSSFGMAAVGSDIYAMGGDSFNSSDEVLRMDFSAPLTERYFFFAIFNYAEKDKKLFCSVCGRPFPAPPTTAPPSTW